MKNFWWPLKRTYPSAIAGSAKRRGCLLSYSQAELGRELTQPSSRLLAEPCTLTWTVLSIKIRTPQKRIGSKGFAQRPFLSTLAALIDRNDYRGRVPRNSAPNHDIIPARDLARLKIVAFNLTLPSAPRVKLQSAMQWHLTLFLGLLSERRWGSPSEV